MPHPGARGGGGGTGDLQDAYDNSADGQITLDATRGALKLTRDDTNRATNTDVLTLTHTTSDALFGGTGMGVGILFRLEDDLGVTDDAARIKAEWNDAGSPSPTADVVLMCSDTAGALIETTRFSNTTSGLAHTVAVLNAASIADVVTLTQTQPALAGGGAFDATFTPAAGYGNGILFKGLDNAGALTSMGRSGVRWTDASGVSEDAEFFWQVPRAGGGLGDVMHVSGTEFRLMHGGAAEYTDGEFSFVTATTAGIALIKSTDTSGNSGWRGVNSDGDVVGGFVDGSAVAGTLLDTTRARGAFYYSSRQTAIGTAGAFAITLATSNEGRWQITSSGHLVAVDDATYDFGASGATRPRDIHLSRNLVIGGALDHDGTTVGFYGTAPVVKQTGVAVTAAGVHAALVNLGLIAA